MTAGPLPECVDKFEYAVVEASLDYLLNITDEIDGYDIMCDEDRVHARFVVVVKTNQGDFIGIAATLMEAATEAVDMFRSGPNHMFDPDLGGDEPEAA